jgi:hypothetical protein
MNDFTAHRLGLNAWLVFFLLLGYVRAATSTWRCR